jgi:hypothetical protein
VQATATNQYTGKNFVICRSEGDWTSRIGIYMRGSCDLNSLFACAPLIQPVLKGTSCIIHDGIVADSRSDVLLQTTKPHPETVIRLLLERFELPADHFTPTLFDETFSVAGPDGSQEFPKGLVIMSIGADVERTAYRHRENGLIVDPGAAWLHRPMDKVLGDLSRAAWFRDNFEGIGRIPVQDFVSNFTEIIQLLKQRTRAQIMVLNTLAPDPRSVVHNYQFVRDSLSFRRREFNLALVELSRNLNFSILDVNRVLQRVGISGQRDWAHHHPSANLAIAREAFRIMQELALF